MTSTSTTSTSTTARWSRYSILGAARRRRWEMEREGVKLNATAVQAITTGRHGQPGGRFVQAVLSRAGGATDEGAIVAAVTATLREGMA